MTLFWMSRSPDNLDTFIDEVMDEYNMDLYEEGNMMIIIEYQLNFRAHLMSE